jgi:hypothetical protein
MHVVLDKTVVAKARIGRRVTDVDDVNITSLIIDVTL